MKTLIILGIVILSIIALTAVVMSFIIVRATIRGVRNAQKEIAAKAKEKEREKTDAFEILDKAYIFQHNEFTRQIMERDKKIKELENQLQNEAEKRAALYSDYKQKTDATEAELAKRDENIKYLEAELEDEREREERISDTSTSRYKEIKMLRGKKRDLEKSVRMLKKEMSKIEKIRIDDLKRQKEEARQKALEHINSRKEQP